MISLDIYTFRKGWLFHLEDELYKKTGKNEDKDIATRFGLQKTGNATGFAARKFENSNWRTVSLPHDYAVELPFDRDTYASQGLKPINETADSGESPRMRADKTVYPIAWYRKTFFMDENGRIDEEHTPLYGDCNMPCPRGKRFFLVFEGAYRDYTVWVNGVYMDRCFSGYREFVLDVTDQLLFGETNSVAVRINADQYEGWWYDGAGLYRSVKLLTVGDIFCLPEDFYVHTEENGRVQIFSELTNARTYAQNVHLSVVLRRNGNTIASDEQTVRLSVGKTAVEFLLQADEPRLWDISAPELYTVELQIDGCTELVEHVGFKSVVFDPNKGLILNGRSVKLQGVCLHQDLFGVGVAVPKELVRYKLEVMKQAGVNAVRTVHNPPSRDLLDLCDEMGLLVMDETRMFGSSPEALRQLEALVKRDRNHVCLLMWSIGNEEMTVQDTTFGKRMAETALRTLRKLTVAPSVSYGGNNGNRYNGINETLTLRGMNYIRISPDMHPDDYHREHPEQVLFSSEEISVLSARGVYTTDKSAGHVDAYGENTMPWGSTVSGFMRFCHERDYYMGGFCWTGFDYRGEPTPFGESGKRNPVGNFGMVDLCGFPKDIYYCYKSHWTDEPVLHLLPHWNFKSGEKIRVVAHTNCDRIALYLNGRMLASQSVAPFESPEWEVVFEPGELKAVGYKGGGTVECVRHTSSMVALAFDTEAYGEYTLVTVKAVDAWGDVFPNACSNISFEASDRLQIIGAGNGDPSSFEREAYYAETVYRELPMICTTCRKKDAVSAELPYFEAPDDHYFDKCRRIWFDFHTQEPDEYTFEAELTTEESYDFFEFSSLSAEEATVFVNDIPIGGFSGSENQALRPFRFMCSLAPGYHRIRLEVRACAGRKVELSGAKLGKTVNPTVKRRLWNGLLKLIVVGSGRLTAVSDNGFMLTESIRA